MAEAPPPPPPPPAAAAAGTGAPPPRLTRKPSNLPPALTPMLKSLGLEEEDPEEVFEIEGKEGAGAFGRVFRARYREASGGSTISGSGPSPRPALAALKVIPVALEAGQRGEDIANVRREIQFLRECDHPNVVAFYGAYYKDGALWVAMEYCGGGSVGDVSRQRRLSESEIARIVHGALLGLAYLHRRKKLHRDIKGGNILLTGRGEVKLADFGVSAQLKDTMSRRGTFVGTPYWMSPEMIQESDYDAKSDIWSLGITMIELADQRPPLFDEHPMRVLIQIPRNPPPCVREPQRWSPLFLDFLRFCLRKDPRERPSAIECLAHPFVVRGAEGIDRHHVGSGSGAEAAAMDIATERPIRAPMVAAPAAPPLPRAQEEEEKKKKEEEEATAEDVTLRAGARPMVPPLPATTEDNLDDDDDAVDGDVDDVADDDDDNASELRTPASSVPPSRRASMLLTASELGTPRDDADSHSRSAIALDSEEVAEAITVSDVTSSGSSRDDDDDDDDDGDLATSAAVQGFAFRQPEPVTAPVVGTAAAAMAPDKPSPPLEPKMISGAELLVADDDDSMELPAMVIGKIQAAAKTLAAAGQTLRSSGRGPDPAIQTGATSSPARTRSPALSPKVFPTGSSSPPPVPVAASSPTARGGTERNLSPRTPSGRLAIDSAHNHSGHNVFNRPQVTSSTRNPSSPATGGNPLADIDTSHERVSMLLSSLSASTARLFQAAPRGIDGEAVPPPPSTSTVGADSSTDLTVSGSTNHFIGTPFRVAHAVNVRFNTVDARFEGAPATATWGALHRQFGVPVGQLRARSQGPAHVPALLHMLRRGLVRREGLRCKFIYRVPADQHAVAHARQQIDNGAFDVDQVSDPHVFASLLKLWLRELPSALLAALPRPRLAEIVERLAPPSASTTTTNTPNLLPHKSPRTMNDEGEGDAVAFARPFPEVHAELSSTLLLLPVAERAVLLWLVDHLLEVIEHRASNGMTAQSLAVVMAPSVYRWASSTPEDARATSHQVAEFLRLLLTWRRRSLGGSSTMQPTPTTSTTSTPLATQNAMDVRSLSLSRSVTGSLRASLEAIRGRPGGSASLSRRSGAGHGGASAELSQQRQSISNDKISSTVSAVDPTDLPPVGASSGRQSLEAALRALVDGLWSELPTSIIVDSEAVIIRSLHKKYQLAIFDAIAQHGKRPSERQWALEMRRMSGTSFTSGRPLPLSLRRFDRWLEGATRLDAFVALLEHERTVRGKLDKLHARGSTSSTAGGESPPGTWVWSTMFDRWAHQTPRGPDASSPPSKEEDRPEVAEGETHWPEHGAVLLDGASYLLRCLVARDPTTTGRLVEDLAAHGHREPVVGNVLKALSSHQAQRHHLDREHALVEAQVVTWAGERFCA